MATLDTLEISYDRKIQLDQFEPVTVGAVGTFALEADDDPYEVFQAGQASMQEMVERELAARVARKKLEDSGPSVPKIKGVLREEPDVLDDDAIAEIAERLADQ